MRALELTHVELMTILNNQSHAHSGIPNAPTVWKVKLNAVQNFLFVEMC